jgi:hypothetical protein
LTPPLEHLKVWEGRGTSGDIVVDYISTEYLDKHLGTSREQYDTMIVSGMVTQKLAIDYRITPLFKLLHSSVLFRQLMAVTLKNVGNEMHPLPYLERLDELEISFTTTPTYSLDIALPCVCAVQQLALSYSTFCWMIGRTFQALKQCCFAYLQDDFQDWSRLKGLQVDMPVCIKLQHYGRELVHFTFLSCPIVQTLQLHLFDEFLIPDEDEEEELIPDEEFLKFLLNYSSLQELEIIVRHGAELSSVFQLVFCDALQQGAWQEIRKVKVMIQCGVHGSRGKQFFNQMVGQKERYERWWNQFTVSKEDWGLTLEACN